MKSDILKSNDIVERILMDLSVYCDIPNKGFLAGGAVSNMLMKYVWHDNYPINDLDVFMKLKIDQPIPIMNQLHQLELMN